MKWQDKVYKYLDQGPDTQESFAAKIEQTQGWLNHKLSGRRATTIEDLFAIARAMNTTMSSLLRDDGPNAPTQISEQHKDYRQNFSDDEIAFLWENIDDDTRKRERAYLRSLVERQSNSKPS